jgi:aminopeptidase N
VLINETAHNMIPSAVEAGGGRIIVIPRQARMKETVGEDVTLSLNYFTDAFGDPPGKRFSATEISGGHGQAFPGLIHFSWATYHGFLLEKGEDEAFRSHEVAHQWWGLGVAVKSYRDAWISEGFSTFSSWLYTEAILGDTVALGRMLKRSKEEVMSRRNGAGPIWLGTRLGSDAFPQDYAIQVYDKGAWVLRMLRNLMFDENAGDAEAPFRRMMRDFYQQNRGKLASTADFRATVERHMGKPMDWFFESWVYGTGIPTYEWSYLTETAGDGKTTVKLRVAQKQVPDDFAMIVPVRLEFDDGQSRTERFMVKGPTTEVSLEVAAKPARVVLNPSDAVLAEVKQAKWR